MPLLSKPTMASIRDELNAEVLNSRKRLSNIVEDIIVGAMGANNAVRFFQPGTLIITPGDREDIVLAAANEKGEIVRYFESNDVASYFGSPTARNGETGKYEPSAEIVVHLDYAGKKVDVPMRYRGNAKQPELEFWVAKWVVPTDAPTGIIRYSATAKDKKGRTGEFKPFRQDLSELTVVE